MLYHYHPDLWVKHITQQRNEYKEDEKRYVQGKDDDGYPVKPCTVVRQVVEKDGNYTGSHIDGEPSEEYVSKLDIGNGEDVSVRRSERCKCSRRSLDKRPTARLGFDGYKFNSKKLRKSRTVLTMA